MWCPEVTAFAASLPGLTQNLGYVASTRPDGSSGMSPGGGELVLKFGPGQDIYHPDVGASR